MHTNWSDTWWLAKLQMRDNALAYLLTFLYFAFMGLVLSADPNIGTEIALPILMLILIQPSLSSKYMSIKSDNEVVRHQLFLTSIPLSFNTIMLARVIAMLAAGVINIPVFFLPFWFLADDWSSFPHFLAWVAFWVGMGLVGTGIALVQEFRFSVRSWTHFNFAFAIILAVVLILLAVLAGFRPYAQTVRIADSHPILLAVAGLAIGVITLVASVPVAVRAFRRREFTR